MKTIQRLTFTLCTLLLITIGFGACNKNDFLSPSSTKAEKSIAEKISYNDFTNAITSTDKLILKIRMTPKAAITNGYLSVMGATGTNTFVLQDFEIDTTKIVAVRKSNGEIYYSMRLLSKKDSSNNCFYNLYVKKDSNNQITQTIVKYLPTAKSIKNNYKNFDAKCFVLQNNMNISVNTNPTVTTNSVATMDLNQGCVEVAYDIPCEYGYVHEEGDGPGIWCDGNGSYKKRFLNCGIGGTSSSGSGSATGGNGNGSGNSSGNVLVTPGSNTNNIINCEVPETDQFINQLYTDNIVWASQNVNIFNQLCGSLCGDASETNKDFIQWAINYLSQHPTTYTLNLIKLISTLGLSQAQIGWLDQHSDFTNKLYEEFGALEDKDDYSVAAALIGIEVNRLGLPDNFTEAALKAILMETLPPALRIYIDVILPYTILQYNLEVEKDPAMQNAYLGLGRGILYLRATNELLHLSLDFAGMVPVVGEIFDITNAAIYTLQGQYLDAGISISSSIPLVGNIPVAARVITKGKKIIIMLKKGNGLWHFPRKSLRNVLGLVVGDGKIAHHLIPLGEEANELVQKAAHWGFDMNSLDNAKALDAAIHTGNHSVYSVKIGQEMTKILNRYPNGISPQVAKAELDGLINRIRAWIGNNPGVNIDNIIL